MTFRDIFDRLRLSFDDDKELRSSLRAILGFYPHHIDYYKQALTHKSSGQRNDKGKPLNNERLEFLGDALLSAVVGHIVFEHFERQREGFLTNTRSKLVSRETLGKLAQEMGLNDLILSNGQQHTHNSYMAGNAFEALVGAIYLDQGYNAVMRFMRKRILAQMVNIDKVAYKEVNFKSKLIEWTQKNRVRLDFKIEQQQKENNNSPVFGCQVLIEGVVGGIGQGFSKKEAQQTASKETLQRLRREPQFIDAIFLAKSSRTKMEEEPTSVAPDPEADQNFIVTRQQKDDVPQKPKKSQKPKETKKPQKPQETNESNELPKPQKPQKSQKAQKLQPAEVDEFDLSDITANPVEPSREDIIAAAEAAAFAEG